MVVMVSPFLLVLLTPLTGSINFVLPLTSKTKPNAKRAIATAIKILA